MEHSNSDKVVHYFCRILQAPHQPVSVLLSALSVLEQTLRTNLSSSAHLIFKANNVKELLATLIAILSKPCYRFIETKVEDRHQSLTAHSSGSKKQSIHPLVYTLALKCIFQLAENFNLQFNNVLDKPSLQCLMNFLSPQLNGGREDGHSFYQFPCKCSTILTGLLKYNAGNVKFKYKAHGQSETSQQTSQDEMSFYNPEAVKFPQIAGKVKDTKFIQVKVFSQDCEQDVADVLVSEKVAWRSEPDSQTPKIDMAEVTVGKNKASQPKQPAVEEDLNLVSERKNLQWIDGRITTVLEGNFFWALLGKDSMETFMALSTSLMKDLKSKRLKPAMATVGKLIVVDLTSGGERQLVRAQVLVSSKGVLTVFCVDTGAVCVVPAHTAYCVPAEFSLSDLPALASLSRIAGVRPPPLEQRAVTLVLVSLARACRPNVNVTSMLLELDIVSRLTMMIGSPEPDVVREALLLLVNILSRQHCTFGVDWQHIVWAIVERLGSFVQQVQEKQAQCVRGRNKEGDKGDHLYGCASPMNDGDANPTEDEPTAAVASRHLLVPALLVLSNRLFLNRKARNYLYQIQGLEVVLRILALLPRRLEVRRCVYQVLANFVHIFSRRSNRMYTQSLRCNDDANTNSQTRGEGSPSLDKLQDFINDEEEDDEDEDGDDSGLGACGDGLWPLAPCDDGLGEDGDEVMTVTYPEVYIYGTKVAFTADTKHEFLHKSHIAPGVLSTVICGMLNTGEDGRIYLGISEDGKIQGEKLNHDARDELRLGIDNIMRNRLVPPMLHSQFHVKYTPVVQLRCDEEGRETRVPCYDLFVMEITCRPVPKMTYCTKGDKCYYRAGAATMEISQQDVRQMIVMDEEVMYKDHMDQLRQELEHLTMEEAMT